MPIREGANAHKRRGANTHRKRANAHGERGQRSAEGRELGFRFLGFFSYLTLTKKILVKDK